MPSFGLRNHNVSKSMADGASPQCQLGKLIEVTELHWSHRLPIWRDPGKGVGGRERREQIEVGGIFLSP